MTLEQRLQSEIQDSKRWIECTQNNSTHKRDLKKRVELINWVLINMKNPDIQICPLIETRTNQIIDDINKKDSVLEDHPLDSKIRILDWVLFLVYCTE